MAPHPKLPINHKNWLFHTRIKLDGNGHFLLLTMVVSACNIRFLLVFDTYLTADQTMICISSMFLKAKRANLLDLSSEIILSCQNQYIVTLGWCGK